MEYSKSSNGGMKLSPEDIIKRHKIALNKKEDYRALYEQAMKGKSRKAAQKIGCLECCGWEIKEVFLCSDVGCPHYPYRPTSRLALGHSQRFPQKRQSKNSNQRVFSYG